MLTRLVIVGLIAVATPALSEMVELCPGGAIWRDNATHVWSCGPSSAMPTPQPTFAYAAPTPQPTKALDPTTTAAGYDFAATTSNACLNGPSTITVAGAVDGDACIVGVPAAAIGTGVTYHCHVSAANTVTLRACKLGTTTFNPPAGNFTVRIVRP